MNGTENNTRSAVFSEIYSGPADLNWLRGEAPGAIHRMIRTSEWALWISYPEDTLYGPDGAFCNLVDDPAEVHNIYYDRTYRAEVSRLRDQLIDWAES